MPVLRNQRRELFAQEMAKAKTATEAMAVAGFSDPRNSTRLMKIDEIQCRIVELSERGAARAEMTIAVTLDSLMRELEEARQLAFARGQASAAVSATVGKARLAGLIIERREVGQPGQFDGMTDEQLVEEATRRAKELGLSFRPQKAH